MTDNSTPKIIMNYMPPAIPLGPSLAFSILKSFIVHNGYNCRVIYWNRLIYDLIVSRFIDFEFAKGIADMDISFLTPFLYDLSVKYNDSVVQERILSSRRAVSPKYETKRKSYSELLNSINEAISIFIDTQLEKIEANSVLLFGFSAKFYQWIPGMLLSEKYKSKFPGIKIVIGGFLDKISAVNILRTCPGFDFAIWGEGEYPLLELSNHLKAGDMDWESVPRLAYRDRDNVKTTKTQSKYLSLQDYIQPDFTDFIEMPESNSILSYCSFSIESSRSCHWNRCKFCYLNRGYKYRLRSCESVLQEIESLFEKYRITNFQFADCDIVGGDIGRLEKFLNMLIGSSVKNFAKYSFNAEMNHYGLNSRIIEKLSVAGFNIVQIGYEALTDDLLKKIDKRTDFSDNLLFVKFALKYGISVAGANIIRGIVGETEADVRESTKNLVYLRFFLSSKRGKFSHNPTVLAFQEGSRFLKMLDKKERKECKCGYLRYLLPQSLLDNKRCLNLMGFTWNLKNKIEWENFEKVNKFYEEADITYKILKNNGFYYYSEYMNEELINYIVFNEPEHWEVLKAANDEVTSFETIFKGLKKKFPDLTEKYLTEIIGKLKSHYLLYANRNLTRIVSIIDVGDID